MRHLICFCSVFNCFFSDSLHSTFLFSNKHLCLFFLSFTYFTPSHYLCKRTNQLSHACIIKFVRVKQMLKVVNWCLSFMVIGWIEENVRSKTLTKFPMVQKSQLLITWKQYFLNCLYRLCYSLCTVYVQTMYSSSTMKKSDYETQEHELHLSKQRTHIFPWLGPGICMYF